jgi:hypothetical protein
MLGKARQIRFLQLWFSETGIEEKDNKEILKAMREMPAFLEKSGSHM